MVECGKDEEGYLFLFMSCHFLQLGVKMPCFVSRKRAIAFHLRG